MPRLKKATVREEVIPGFAYKLACPYCGGATNQTGKPYDTVRCKECGRNSKVPLEIFKEVSPE
jgi:tRNA(Ile2) C34 agmatinyltransferase TiaS